MRPTRILVYAAALIAALADPASAQPAPAANFWGVSSSASAFKDHAEWFPTVAAAGVGSVRLFPEWNGFQTKDGGWTWDHGDLLVKNAAANKLELTAILMGAPPGTKASHTFPMNDLDGWAKYVTAVIGRYKGQIKHWEVWNEGNAAYNDGKHTTADYAKLAAVTYAAAKKADPQARVGLSVASYDAAYLRQTILAMAKAGTPDCFDYLCIHPYEVADGLANPHGEIPYLWMSRLIRDTLKEVAPAKADAEIWITEVGRRVEKRQGHKVTEADAAAGLVKIYTLAAAQGIARVQWFEARDPVGEDAGFGLLRRDGTPRPAYVALQRLAAALGPKPTYLGWVALRDGKYGYGFLFDGKAGPVLVTWMSPSEDDQGGIIDAALTITDVTTGAITPVKPNALFLITQAPVLVTGLPPGYVAKAKANAALPFAWGGDHSTAKVVAADFSPFAVGKPVPINGVFRTGRSDQPTVKFDDGTGGILLQGDIGHPVSFFVHPSFAKLSTKEYYVRVTVRRVADGNVGMNLLYGVADSQGRSPYRNAEKWFGMTKDDGWQTYTWHVKDASFAKMWGHDVTIRPEQSIPFALGKVEVSTQPFK